MNQESLIISAKNVQPLFSRIRDVLLTALLWFAYIYLMEDFFRFLTTIFNWLVFNERTPELAADFKVLKTIECYLMVVVVNSCILLAWAMYNQVRFRGKERRKPLPAIGAPDLARLYNVQSQEVIEWQKLKIMTMYHDAYGNLIKIEPK